MMYCNIGLTCHETLPFNLTNYIDYLKNYSSINYKIKGAGTHNKICLKVVRLNRLDLVMPLATGYKFTFFNCPIIILFNFQILKQGTQFGFELLLSLKTCKIISCFVSFLLLAELILILSQFFKSEMGSLKGQGHEI